jgi:hypothetical protein
MHDRYPAHIVFLAAALSLAGLAVGALIFSLLDCWLAAVYILVYLLSLLACMKYRCAFCHYHGKRCYMGLGLLAGVFKKGPAKEFKRESNLMNAGIFSFASLLLPILAAIVLLVLAFELKTMFLLLLYLCVAVVPGFLLRGSVFCRRCKQGKLGCPAYAKMKKA